MSHRNETMAGYQGVQPRDPRNLPQVPNTRPYGEDHPHPQRMVSDQFSDVGRRPNHDENPQIRSKSEFPPPGSAQRPLWSQVLDPGAPTGHLPERDTFVQLEPLSETMRKPFTPSGLVLAGLQDKQARDKRRQEELARETGASLINVPNKPPPQTGLLGAITAHEREREREGMRAALTSHATHTDGRTMSGLFPYDQSPISTVPDLSGQIERTTELVGRGGYGAVYKGRWIGAAANTTPAAVAIKILEFVPLRDEAQRIKRFKQITRELSLWCSIKHENVLPLLGIARINGDTNVPAFVCPWMENGNAKEFCSRNPRFPPMLILYDIINGLHYLHTFQPEIVHGDIKAVNVLINNRCEACLCDFGLSRLLIDNTLWKTTATHAGGTVRWMAPELLDGDASTPTKETDIYAYAMTCYEILSGDVPFQPVSNDMAIPIKVMKGQRPKRTESFHSDFMWDIITRCWEQEPEDRLRTKEVLELLRPKADWKEVEVTLGEKEMALAKVEKEMAVLKEQIAEALTNAAKREQLIHDLSATNQRLHEEIREMGRTTSTNSMQINTLLPPTIAKDSLSVAEVANLVKSLNTDLGQTIVYILESILNQDSPRTGKEPDIVWDELRDYIGSWLCNYLKRRSKELGVEPNLLIMQRTLQAGLVNACSRIVNDWNPPFWSDGLVFSRTYSSMVEKTNGQVTADPWRAQSRTHMTVSQSDRQEATKRYLTEVLLKLIPAVGGSLESAETFLYRYKENVEDIVQNAIGLQKIVSQDGSLMELATFIIPCDTPFDASQMEDTEGESRSGRVACTLEMGLRGRKRDGNGSRKEWGVATKPRVLLVSTLEA